jgi:hypothetical protein
MRASPCTDKFGEPYFLGLACQFRVDHVVRPGAEGAWLLHSPKNISASAPVSDLKCALNDNWRARLHGFERLRYGARIDSKALDRHDREPVCLEVLNVVLFVQSPPLR